VAILLAFAIVLAPVALAQGQRAGEVSRALPTTNIQRAGQQAAAAAQAPVFWQDVVTTDANGRARIALDDGSVLNLGSESSLTVTRHDAGAQQTELELNYGRVRANAVKLARPGAEFKVKTRTAVAGVVGTDFFLSYINAITLLIVFEGLVEFCNLAGQCVTVGAGQTSSVRGDNPPSQPVNVSPSQSLEAGQTTQVAAGVAGAAAGVGVGTFVLIAVVTAVVATIVVATTVNRDDGTQKSPRCCPQIP